MAFFWKRKDSSAQPAPEETRELEVPTETELESDAVVTPGEPAPLPERDQDELPVARKGFFARVRGALADRIKKTRDDFVGQVRAVIKAAGKVDENLIERIEEILIKADVGAETSLKIVEAMREFEARGASTDELLDSFKSQLLEIVGNEERKLAVGGQRPYVMLVVGVNGTGKTTTIGKLAAEYSQAGHRVMVVAADTFRAAAIEQLEIWSKRTGSLFASKAMGADPAGVVYDALERSKAENVDVVLIDTAGRLHTKTNLMEELKKVVRVTTKLMPGAPHETILVLDATTGQNAISQAKVFTEAIPVSALVMTKLDGTAKGGVLIGIRNLFNIPVVKIGVGEDVEDLRDFDPREFIDALFAE